MNQAPWNRDCLILPEIIKKIKSCQAMPFALGETYELQIPSHNYNKMKMKFPRQAWDVIKCFLTGKSLDKPIPNFVINVNNMWCCNWFLIYLFKNI